MLRVVAPFSFAALLICSGADAATIIVANNSDAVNGDTRSPAALARQPGPDGVSLREAIADIRRFLGPGRSATAAAP